MTPEFPALQQALVAAARRRMRRRRTFQVAFPALVAAAAAATVIISLPQAPPDRERAAATPKTRLERDFAVFRRPRTAADVMPVRPDIPEMDPSRSRFVAQAGTGRMYVAPWRGSVCTIVFTGRHWTGGCPTLKRILSVGASQYGNGFEGFFLPDDARDVRITHSDGSVSDVRLHNNALLLATKDLLPAVGWTDAAGTRHFVRSGDAQQVVPDPQGCPRLGPLPADALTKARRVALLAADQYYLGTLSATVTSAVRPSGTPCSAATTRRSVLVTLHLEVTDPRLFGGSRSQARLLVGVVDGHLQVWQVVH